MKKLLQIILTLIVGNGLYSQCTAPGTQSGSASSCVRSIYYHGEILPDQGCGVNTTVTPYSPGEYFRMPVLPGACYTISTCGTSVNTHINVFQGTTSTAPYAFDNDDGPECSGMAASVEFVPNFNDYVGVDIREFNCLPTGSSSITVNVRQNNNLMFTSSSAPLCQGEVRTLTASPNPVSTSQPNAGNLGTFTGTGVSGVSFTAPVPTGDSAVHTITYTYGYCSITQNLVVYHNPTPANAGTDFTTPCGATSANLAGNSPTYGDGLWTVVSGTGIATSPASPTSTVTGLTPGTTTTMRWTISNGPCTVSYSDVTITVPQVPTVVFNNTVDSVCVGSSLINLNGASPAGGTFNGIGVIGSTFDPNSLPPGLYLLSYDYTDTSNGCSATAYDSIRVSACLGIEQLSESDLNVFPNPSSAIFNISIMNDQVGIMQLNVVDEMGRVVYKSIINKETESVHYQLNLMEQPPGIYFVNVLFDKGYLISKRIIKL